MEKIFELYKRMLELHIKTKTTCPLFHEKSEAFYDILFDIFHQVREKKQDIEEDDTMGDEAYQEAYDLLEEAKQELANMIEEKQTYGMDNLLRGLFDKLEFNCGTARGFIGEEKEEEDEEMEEETTKDIKKPLLFK